MAVTRKEKEKALSDLNELLEGAKSVVFADYRGTTVKQIDELRKNLRKENVSAKVAKITLIKRALEKQGIDAAKFDITAPVTVVVSKEDEVAPARIVSDFAKQNQTIQILSGIMDNQLISASEVKALASLPSKQELRAKVVGTIAAPVSGFVNVLAGNLRSLVYVLNAVKESKV